MKQRTRLVFFRTFEQSASAAKPGCILLTVGILPARRGGTVAVKRFLAQDKWKPKDYEAFCAEASHLLTLRCARACARASFSAHKQMRIQVAYP